VADNEQSSYPPSQDYEFGRLHGRVGSLEQRVDKHELVLSSIDSKLDTVLLDLAAAVGARDKVQSMMKWSMAAVGALAALTATIGAFFRILRISAGV
jgi:hypothetical protein